MLKGLFVGALVSDSMFFIYDVVNDAWVAKKTLSADGKTNGFLVIQHLALFYSNTDPNIKVLDTTTNNTMLVKPAYKLNSGLYVPPTGICKLMRAGQMLYVIDTDNRLWKFKTPDNSAITRELTGSMLVKLNNPNNDKPLLVVHPVFTNPYICIGLGKNVYVYNNNGACLYYTRHASRVIDINCMDGILLVTTEDQHLTNYDLTNGYQIWDEDLKTQYIFTDEYSGVCAKTYGTFADITPSLAELAYTKTFERSRTYPMLSIGNDVLSYAWRLDSELLVALGNKGIYVCQNNTQTLKASDEITQLKVLTQFGAVVQI